MPNEDKVKEFLREYGELSKKYGLDFLSQPQFVPTERGVWELQIQPKIVETSIPSSFINEAPPTA